MVISSNTRLGKRKLESTESKESKKEVKSLKEMYDEVVSDNKKNVKVIKELGAKVTIYEKERNLNLKPSASVVTQT